MTATVTRALWVQSRDGSQWPAPRVPDASPQCVSLDEFLTGDEPPASVGYDSITVDLARPLPEPLGLSERVHRGLERLGRVAFRLREASNRPEADGAGSGHAGRAEGRECAVSGGRTLRPFRFDQASPLPGSGTAPLDFLKALAVRAGFAEDARCAPERAALSLIKHSLPRYQISLAREADAAACRELFLKVFQANISPAFWDWKYADGRGHSLLGRRAGELVAHYGATARRILFRGREARALQICDVMVAAHERGLLTRRGAFFQVARAFQEVYYGYYDDFLLAYGFPYARSMRLGERLGLYAEADRVTEVSWSAAAATGWARCSMEPLASGTLSERVVQRLWKAMSKDLAGRIAVVRDREYLIYRYLAHPEKRYDCLLVRGRLSHRVIAVVVLYREERRCKLMDVVCDLKDLRRVIDGVRRHIAQWGVAELVGWVASSQLGLFMDTGCTARPTDIVIPEHAWTGGVALGDVRERWWIAMGDTEFL